MFISTPHRNAGGFLSLVEVVEVTIDGEPVVATCTLLCLLSECLLAFLLGFRCHGEVVREVPIDKQCRLVVQHVDVCGESK